MDIKTRGCSHGQPCPTKNLLGFFKHKSQPIITCSPGGVVESCSIYQCGLQPYASAGCTCCPGPCNLGNYASFAGCRRCIPNLSGRLHCSFCSSSAGMLDLSQTSHNKWLILMIKWPNHTKSQCCSFEATSCFNTIVP